MSRSTAFAAAVVLTALAPFGSAHAQLVHKCVVNGATLYQSGPCPAANEEKTVIIPPPPSQQELLEATANGRLQQYQASTGRLVQPSQRRYVAQQASRQPSPQQAPDAPGSNCERLNQTYHELQYRRDELSAPGAGGVRADALQRVNDELKRTAEQANLTRCHLR